MTAASGIHVPLEVLATNDLAKMRVLTVRQPWAWAIISGGKSVENCVRNLVGNYRGAVAIHTSKRLPSFEEHWAAGSIISDITGYRPLFHSPDSLGAIIGVVELVGVHESGLDGCGTRKGVANPDELIPLCSEWAEPLVYHLVLANPRPLAHPIPFRGAVGLRRLPAETVALIGEQVTL